MRAHRRRRGHGPRRRYRLPRIASFWRSTTSCCGPCRGIPR